VEKIVFRSLGKKLKQKQADWGNFWDWKNAQKHGGYEIRREGKGHRQ